MANGRACAKQNDRCASAVNEDSSSIAFGKRKTPFLHLIVFVRVFNCDSGVENILCGLWQSCNEVLRGEVVHVLWYNAITFVGNNPVSVLL